MRRNTIDDILRRVERSENGCWEWQGARCVGYGVVNWAGKPKKAHRIIYEHYVGPIPDGLVIDHLCRNKGCVNPEHLEPVTNEENFSRGNPGIDAIQRAKTHCLRGHPFNEENTRASGPDKKWRLCIECRRAHGRDYWRRKGLSQLGSMLEEAAAAAAEGKGS